MKRSRVPDMRPHLATALALALLIGLPGIARSDAKIGTTQKIGLGGQLGDTTGFSFKYFFANQHALDATAGTSWWEGPAFGINVDYLFHLRLARTASFVLPLYFGVGAKLLLWFDRDCHYYWGKTVVCRRDDEGRLGFTLRVPLGVAFHLSKLPLEIYGELGLLIGLVPYVGVALDGAIGVRYYL